MFFENLGGMGTWGWVEGCVLKLDEMRIFIVMVYLFFLFIPLKHSEFL